MDIDGLFEMLKRDAEMIAGATETEIEQTKKLLDFIANYEDGETNG